MTKRSWLGVFILAAGLSGCGGDSSDPVTVDSFCRQKAEKECAEVAEARCATSAADCRDKRFAACKALETSQNVAPRQFKEQNMNACLSKASGTLSKQSISPQEWKDLRDVCNRVWEGNGTLSGNTTCQSQYDCLKEFICDKGFCTTRKVQAQDQFCNNPGEVCGATQSCQAIPPNQNKCQNKGGIGAACGATAPCLDQYFCKVGTCSEKLVLNDDCTSDDQCASGLCEPFQKKCLLNITFSPNGATCSGFLAGADSPGSSTPTNPDAGSNTPTPDAGAGQ